MMGLLILELAYWLSLVFVSWQGVGVCCVTALHNTRVAGLIKASQYWPVFIDSSN